VRVSWLATVAGCGFHPAGFGTGSNVAIDASAVDSAVDAAIDAPRDAAAPAAGWVQGISATGANDTSVNLAYTHAQRAGDLDVVVVSWGQTSTHVASISDTVGDTFTRIGNSFNTGLLTQAMYYAPNITAGANTITVTFDATADQPELRIAEYAGAVTSMPVEHFTEANGTGQTMNLMLIATSNAHDLLVAANTVEAMTDQIDPTYTLRLNENGDVLFDKIVTSAGQYSANAHLSSNAAWVFFVVAFKLTP
jgi:hypothetical protein